MGENLDRNVLKENVSLDESLVIPILVKEALEKDLQLFVFKGKELEQYWEVQHQGLGVALLAKDKDNAIVNIRGLRRCYLINLDQ